MNPVFVFGFIAAWAAIVVCCWLGWQLLRQNGRILLRLEALEKHLEKSGEDKEAPGLPVGSPAPDFDLPDLKGARKTSAEFLGQPHLLIFFNPECGFCGELAPQLAARWSGNGQAQEGPRLLVITTGEAEQNRRFFAEHKLSSPVLLQQDMEVATVYKAAGTPTGYLINASGTISSELAIGAEALLALADQLETNHHDSPSTPAPSEQAEPSTTRGETKHASRFSNRSLAHSRIKRDGLKAGTPAPQFRLPLLAGGELSLSDLRGEPVFLVFSSPHCGPCNALAPKLEKFHRKNPELKVVMIGRGAAAENRDKVKEHGLTFPVVLQKQWEISRLYAIFASPVAYLIDAAGVITAEVAVGVDPILELMDRAGPLVRQNAGLKKPPLAKRMARWPVRAVAATLDWLFTRVTLAKTGIDTFELKRFRFVPRPDDIFIVTYPRSGTTWMQMILYQLTTDGSMELSHIAEHSPWFERSADSDKGYEERASPRVFKTHLPYKSVPKGPGRYIYVARDGRDVAVSYYNLYRSHNGYKGTFDEFFELFMRGKVVFGSWFEHVGGWWKHRHKLNALFLTYEELVADLEGCLRRIIAFCHLNVPPERLPLIAERCGFAFMKKHENKFDPAVEALWQQGARLNLFVRAGRVGEGARQLNREQRARFDQALQAKLEPVTFDWPAATQLRPRVPSATFGSG